MGQYYKGIILRQDKKTPLCYASSYDFGNGGKLMEHSWVGNAYVGFIEKQLISNPQPMVWSGDYADNEPFSSIPKFIQDGLLKEAKAHNKEYGETYKRDYVTDLKKEGANLYSIADMMDCKITTNINIPSDQNIEFDSIPARYKYILNHDKKQFVDKSKTPKEDDTWGSQIHALPLLTCEGNNRGGGDFYPPELKEVIKYIPENEVVEGETYYTKAELVLINTENVVKNVEIKRKNALIGIWARDVISIENLKGSIPKDFTELKFDLIEN